MSDVMRIALDRRAELHEEIAKLNEFIRYAENLLRRPKSTESEDEAAPRPVSKIDGATAPRAADAPARPAPKEEAVAAQAAEAARPNIVRRGA